MLEAISKCFGVCEVRPFCICVVALCLFSLMLDVHCGGYTLISLSTLLLTGLWVFSSFEIFGKCSGSVIFLAMCFGEHMLVLFIRFLPGHRISRSYVHVHAE